MYSTTTTVARYRDRIEAGQALAKELRSYAGSNTLVLALPRGGVPVGAEVALALRAHLDVFLVRKLGHPDRPEFAMGAIASGGIQLLDDATIAQEHVRDEEVRTVIARETKELARREMLYRSGRPPLNVSGRTVILVDDGVATGYTMRVAVLALRRLEPKKLVVAVPVGAPETCSLLETAADSVVCPSQPTPFMAVGLWYDSFPQLSDDAVRAILTKTENRW
jgi:predicted phosphoribosyltransferase